MPRSWPRLAPLHRSTPPFPPSSPPPPLLLLPLLLLCLLVYPAEAWVVSAVSTQPPAATATVAAAALVDASAQSSPPAAKLHESSTTDNVSSPSTVASTTTSITTTTITSTEATEMPSDYTTTTDAATPRLPTAPTTTAVTIPPAPTTTQSSISVPASSTTTNGGPCLPTTNIHNSLLPPDRSKGQNQKYNPGSHGNVTVVRRDQPPKPVTLPDQFLEAGEESDLLYCENNTLGEELELEGWSATDVVLVAVKAIVMCTIIIVSVLGNVLVIVSVALHRRLHTTANYLLVSLATADMLVALFAMTFNASVELSGGRWMFGRIMCDLWNSFDVYFSTVSILHLCCISVDRYYAIVRPLEYPLTITRRILTIMLAHCWLAPTLISFLPILLGWYTTADHLKSRDSQPYVCTFVVNAVFALVSSAVSFWVPCTVMVVMYYRIFQEARKQEQALLNRACSANATSYSASVRLNASGPQQQHQYQQQDPAAAAAMARQQLLVALQSTPFTPGPRHQEFLMKTFSDTSSLASVATTSSGVPSVVPSGSNSSRSSSGAGMTATAGNGAGTSMVTKPGSATNGNSSGTSWRHLRHGSTASWHGPSSRHGSHMPCNRRLHSTPLVATKSGGTVQVGRREHKAARTLGLIMGAFVLCWLPFFTWYVSINVCGPSCPCPHAVVTALFWIGYFNSTLNPFIYAYFRTDFREAFHRTLKRMRCCRSRQPAGVFV